MGDCCTCFGPKVTSGNTCIKITKNSSHFYKACPSESGTEVGAPLFPAVEICDFPGRWQCMSGEI